MSVHYIIDGYNLVRHKALEGGARGTDERRALVRCIIERRLCGSLNNKATVVFDGFPPQGLIFPGSAQVDVLFSREETADEKIKQLLESVEHPRSVLVVSNDNQVRFAARSAGARVLKVEEFAAGAKKFAAAAAGKRHNQSSTKDQISQGAMLAINKELRSLWFKE